MEVLKVTGKVKLALRNAEGEIIHAYEGNNLVTNYGQNFIAGRMNSAAAAVPSHLSVGSDGTAPSKEHTALQGTEHERVSGTPAVVDNVYAISAEFGSGISGDVTCAEFGIFDAASGGNMIARFITTEFTMSATDTLEVDWQLTIGS